MVFNLVTLQITLSFLYYSHVEAWPAENDKEVHAVMPMFGSYVGKGH